MNQSSKTVLCLIPDPGRLGITKCPSWETGEVIFTQLEHVKLSGRSFGPEFCIVWLWLWEILASGWGSLWESYAFRAVPEWPWISGLRRKSSIRESAPKMLLSVLLNSWGNFFVTLPSISPETRLMESSCDLRAFEFCAKLLLGSSSQFSLFSAAIFLLILRVATFDGKSNDQRLLFDCFFSEGKSNWVSTVSR